MENNQEVLFAEILKTVKKTAREQGNSIGKRQVEEAFAELSLSGEQLALVYDYLKKNQIGIDGKGEIKEQLSHTESEFLRQYQGELKALARREAYSEGEKEAITLSAMAGEAAAQQKLIHIYLPKVLEIARLYAGQGVFLEDLVGEGNVALTIGVTMLGCLEHAAGAEGMLGKMIMDAMEDHIASALAESDKDKKALAKVKKVAKQAKKLSGELRRKITVEELEAETGISGEDIREAMRLSGYTIEEIERHDSDVK